MLMEQGGTPYGLNEPHLGTCWVTLKLTDKRTSQEATSCLDQLLQHSRDRTGFEFRRIKAVMEFCSTPARLVLILAALTQMRPPSASAFLVPLAPCSAALSTEVTVAAAAWSVMCCGVYFRVNQQRTAVAAA